MTANNARSFSDKLTELIDFIKNHQPLFVLTGAGCSTASGIPDYRNEVGEWKHQKPVQYTDFCEQLSTRKRYWAKSMLGWPHILMAQPNMAHLALTELEKKNFIQHIVTQNVDGLHQKAGSEKVLNLHGNLDTVTCLDCAEQVSRESVQDALRILNPEFDSKLEEFAPDGDAKIEDDSFSSFNIYPCPACAGRLKPDVVFFGESVPRTDVNFAFEQLRLAGGVLVVGSSLMVFSGYRFCREALASGKAICAINKGLTRADKDLHLKIDDDCGKTLKAVLEVI